MALRVALLLMPALAHASGLEAVCVAGQECASREQEETGMLQTRARKVKTVTVPTNTEECEKLLPGAPIVFDPTCPGMCCFETNPCRFCGEGCPRGGACDDLPAALAQEVKFMPNTTDECYNVSGINTALPIVYDDTCPGACCFETYPCRYCSEGCGGACPEYRSPISRHSHLRKSQLPAVGKRFQEMFVVTFSAPGEAESDHWHFPDQLAG